MRRIAVVLVTIPLVALTPVHAESARALEASARASVLAAEIDVQPAFDPALADSRANASSVGASSLQSVVWPSFLVDAFFFLYGFQSVERVATGIAEARWPQGPAESDATHSNLLFANGGDPDDVPARGGRSHARALHAHASGDVAAASVQLPGDVRIAIADSYSYVHTRDGEAYGHAWQELADLRVGPLRIRSLRGEATATASADRQHPESSLVIAGATVNGTPVAIDDDGVRALARAQREQVEAALEGAGITLRLVPAHEIAQGDAASASSGGLLLTLRAQAVDPSGTPRNVRLGYLLGSASVDVRSAALAAAPRVQTDRYVTIPGTTAKIFVPAPGGNLAREADVARALLLRRRTIIIESASAASPGARGAYAGILLLALGVVGLRPLIRAVARP